MIFKVIKRELKSCNKKERINKIIATFAPRKTGYSAVRLAHLLWEQGVVSSNLTTPTSPAEVRLIRRTKAGSLFIAS